MIEPIGPPDTREAKPRLSARLIWFAVLWLGGLVGVGAVSYALRALIMPS